MKHSADCMLSMVDVNNFEKFMKRHGFDLLPTRGKFEILRLVRSDVREPIVVYDKFKDGFCVTFGAATDWVNRFYEHRRLLAKIEELGRDKMKKIEADGEDDVPF